MRLETFRSKVKFRCDECGKTFQMNGHWYNQIGLSPYLDIKYCWHKLIKHPRKLSKDDLKYLLRLHIVFPVILLLELLNILCIPFRCL